MVHNLKYQDYIMIKSKPKEKSTFLTEKGFAHSLTFEWFLYYVGRYLVYIHAYYFKATLSVERLYGTLLLQTGLL